MKTTYEVRVEGIRFDAAHFATYGGNCEPLHGHSYEVAAEVQGTLGDDSLVVNFIGLKAILRELSKELDHHFMLQTESRVLHIESTETAWKVRTPCRDRLRVPEARRRPAADRQHDGGTPGRVVRRPPLAVAG